MEEKILVTRSSMPSYEEYCDMIKPLWDSHWLTNTGKFHKENMKILFTICARAGSKGVKSKNSRLFLDVPICYYTLSAYKLFCNKYENQFEVIQLALNTDSDELVKQFEDSNVEYIYIFREQKNLVGIELQKQMLFVIP